MECLVYVKRRLVMHLLANIARDGIRSGTSMVTRALLRWLSGRARPALGARPEEVKDPRTGTLIREAKSWQCGPLNNVKKQRGGPCAALLRKGSGGTPGLPVLARSEAEGIPCFAANAIPNYADEQPDLSASHSSGDEGRRCY
ncbi:hypothetical protein NDU88_007871 [Pleurodeles waltl]|uniref:Uncharacterized protein n=1 Tax=Pleurodeles waltl TaxID=8319 RepID=A0AAV7N3C0_PLEWA|nr:hypothetical protein NDU88_007871 [Pleurodeles waltl]